MLTNYMKTGVQQLLGSKLHFLINVIGLAAGFSCVVLLGLFVRYELGFDQHHPAHARTYRLSWESDRDGAHAANSYWLVPSLQSNLPEVETGGRLVEIAFPVIRENVVFSEAGLRFVDPAILDLFSFQWLVGDKDYALSNPGAVVLTTSAANKYFGGDVSPIGKTLLINDAMTVEVTGVVADLPGNTHLTGELFVSMSTLVTAFGEGNISANSQQIYHSYIRLDEGVVIDEVYEAMEHLMLAPPGGPARDEGARLIATPVNNIHLQPLNGELSGARPGSLATVLAYALIALGILVIAGINFVNLSTARYSLRAREVGVRKSVGASRQQLMAQFLGESVMLSLMAMGLAIVIAELVQPVLGNLLGLGTGSLVEPGQMWSVVLICLGISVLMGLIAGFYPAFLLSGLHAGKVLKGDSGVRISGQLFRNLLVVVQFAVAISLIVSLLVIYAQMRFLHNLDPGFNRSNIVVLSGPATEQWPAMKQELRAHQDIIDVTASNKVPGPAYGYGELPVYLEGRSTPFITSLMSVDYGFFETYGIDLLSGRYFDAQRATDALTLEVEGKASGAFLLSEMAVRAMGWTPEEAIGKRLEMMQWSEASGQPAGEIIGVVNDVYYASLHLPQRPMVYFVGRPQFGRLSFNFVSISIDVQNPEAVLEFIDTTWHNFMPEFPAQRTFLDDSLGLMYQAESRQNALITAFTLLAVLIASMGLYGLASFNAACRTREIGVRKVMGGSVWSIVLLLTNDFSKLVLISNVIAWPIAYVAMIRWLEQFAYRIDLTPLVFIGSGLIALCIAWVTVGGTAAKAASTKPVLALRYE